MESLKAHRTTVGDPRAAPRVRCGLCAPPRPGSGGAGEPGRVEVRALPSPLEMRATCAFSCCVYGLYLNRKGSGGPRAVWRHLSVLEKRRTFYL